MTLIIGAALFVVHDALEMILSEPSNLCSLTPKTIVGISEDVVGAEIMIF
jgi:hypothetical protein